MKLVDGGVLYLETSDGTVVTVRTTDRAAVQTSKASDLSKLKAGQSVSVQGDRADDSTVTATTVTAPAEPSAAHPVATVAPTPMPGTPSRLSTTAAGRRCLRHRQEQRMDEPATDESVGDLELIGRSRCLSWL